MNIIITGAAGFIGSCLVSRLNAAGHRNVMLVDDFRRPGKEANLEEKEFGRQMDREAFPDWLDANGDTVDFVYHLGARTDTAEQDVAIFDHLNLNYSRRVWQACTQHRIPLVYASSAATYGDGSHGYSDSHAVVPELRPLNPYGQSKQDFDLWALGQETTPPRWAGLKFFNVYGPNEYHKERMASVILHTFRQIQKTGRMKLFRSHRPDIADGHQQRDFVYIKDVVDVLFFFLENETPDGLYNLGTGKARTFLDLASETFRALDRVPDIQFIDTPEDIRENYQYFTQADMSKLRAAGYAAPFISLEAGVRDYVRTYLRNGKYY